MSTYNPRQQQPVRHHLTDPRSSAAPAQQDGRKIVLNDARSTRKRSG